MENEKNLTIRDIISEQKIYIINEKEENKIKIIYNDNLYSIINCSLDLTLDKLKIKFPNEIPSNANFLFEFEIL